MAHGNGTFKELKMLNRRQFNKGLFVLALSGLATHLHASERFKLNRLMGQNLAYGPLVSDPDGILDLPTRFSYRIISQLDELMQDGLPVPDRADGMGCFALDEERIVLVRNHELSPPKEPSTLFSESRVLAENVFDSDSNGYPLPGGTSHIVYNLQTGKVERQFMSLLGTIRNCSGGTTPWGSWLSCEESVANASQSIGKNHGYVFEVPALAEGLVTPLPLKQMGRFNHEAACVDPQTGIVYLTEDRGDSLFYRFLPNQPGKLAMGGKLQALAIKNSSKFDTRNWDNRAISLNSELSCSWLDLENVDGESDDLRIRGFDKGAALFARGEGIHFDNGEMYFCCTSGGKQKLGQIMRYRPSEFEGTAGESIQPGKLSLFLESADKVSFNYGDNITVAPSGYLLVCEDQYSDTVNNHLKGVTPTGEIYDFAKVRWQTEPAGVCFSPDGSTLFVNLYSPTTTLAITGPWGDFKS
jgi:secreted PhoX family phosphatase